MSKVVKQHYNPPEYCDICPTSINHSKHKYPFVDGKTTQGPWANMCPACFEKYGRGLGTGKGQRYEFSADLNVYVKVEG